MISEYFAFKFLSHDNPWVNFTLKWDLSNGEARSKNDFVLVFFVVLFIPKTKIEYGISGFLGELTSYNSKLSVASIKLNA